MIFTWEIADRMQCGKKEKQAAAEIIDIILEAAETARREGLLALEDDMERFAHPLLRTGMQLVIEGTDPELIQEILATRIFADNKKGRALLEQLIAYRGCLRIQAGDNPRILADQLFAFLGDDGESIKADYLQNSIARREKEMVTQFLEADSFFRKTAEDLNSLAAYDDRSIQMTLREIDLNDLALILQGADREVRKKVISNMSEKAAVLLVEQAQYAPAGQEKIQNSSVKLWNIVNKLKEQGDI